MSPIAEDGTYVPSSYYRTTSSRRRGSQGRKQRSATATARMRRPNVRKFYGRELKNIRPGDFEFSLTLLRGRGLGNVRIDTVVEAFDWTDEEAAMAGSLSLRRPDPDKPKSLPVARGHRVQCRCRPVGATSWYELWTMRCGSPETSVTDGTVTVELADDLSRLSHNRRDWTFRKTKRRKQGYFAHDITKEVCRREGVKVGALAKGTVRIDKLVKKDTDALTMIREAYKKEQEKTGRRFVIRMRKGRLEVTPFQRNRILYQFANQLQDVQLSEEQKDKPITVLEGKGRIGKGKGAKRVRYTEARRDIVDRLGYAHQEKDYGRVDSLKDLRERVQRDYSKNIEVKRTASFTTAGVPFIRRGHGIRWKNVEPGWHGKSESSLDRTFVYATSVRHRVDSSGYVTEMDIAQEDPFQKDEERLDKEAREKARKARKKRQRGDQN